MVWARLQNMDGDRLVNLQPDGGWGPVVDGVEVPFHPREAIKKGAVHQGVPIVIGGAYEDAMTDLGPGADADVFHKWLEFTKAPKGIEQAYLNDNITKTLYHGPLGVTRRGWSPAYWAVRSASADKDMNCPALQAAQMWRQASGARAHWYLWAAANPDPNHVIPPAAKTTNSYKSPPDCWPCPGAEHGSDLPYLFEHSQIEVDDDVAQLANVYQAFIGNFVKTANPNNWNGFFFATATGNMDMSKEGVAWTTTTRGHGGMLFSPGNIHYVPGLKQDVCDLWGKF